MQRGMLQKVAALCGPTSVNRFGKPCDLQAEVGARARRPLVPERRAADARISIRSNAPVIGVEAGGVDDHVELVVSVARPDAARRDPPIGVSRTSTRRTFGWLKTS